MAGRVLGDRRDFFRLCDDAWIRLQQRRVEAIAAPTRTPPATPALPLPRVPATFLCTMSASPSGAAHPVAREKERRLAAWMRERAPVLLGFSGGVDSAYLACVGVEALGAERFLAVIGRSASYPAEQWEGAHAVARQFGVPVLEVGTDEMNDPRYAANPANRCYFCKSELWTRLGPIARERGFRTVIDGTNADDLLDHRPGALAAREQGVESPLAELGFTKEEIRLLSRERGLPTWRQPSSPCLSSRIPYGTAVTAERLRAVEVAERRLRELGIAGDLRVRYHGELARVELARGELAAWLTPEGRAAIRAAVVGAGFRRVALDLRGFRSGSLNVLSGVAAAAGT